MKSWEIRKEQESMLVVSSTSYTSPITGEVTSRAWLALATFAIWAIQEVAAQLAEINERRWT